MNARRGRFARLRRSRQGMQVEKTLVPGLAEPFLRKKDSKRFWAQEEQYFASINVHVNECKCSDRCAVRNGRRRGPAPKPPVLATVDVHVIVVLQPIA